MKKILLYTIICVSALSSCVSYEAEDFTGHTLPRKTGYSTGVTNDWLYFDLKSGRRFNVLNPNQSIIVSVNDVPVKDYYHCSGDTTVYWYEGAQKDTRLKAKEDKYASDEAAGPTTEWDIAFDGYRLRTNGGTSGVGKGAAADLGYGEYDKWTSKTQVDTYLSENNIAWTVDDSASVYVTMSQNDWNKYCIKNHLDMDENPWFDPNNGPAKQLVSANPVLANAMSFSGPPPVYSPSFHTYVIRSYDGERYYKIQIVSWYDANVEIGDEGGKMSYYLDELK